MALGVFREILKNNIRDGTAHVVMDPLCLVGGKQGVHNIPYDFGNDGMQLLSDYLMDRITNHRGQHIEAGLHHGF